LGREIAVMLKRLHLKNFTVFESADFQFSPQMNVFVGENGAGKTHLLKLAYVACAVQSEARRQGKEPTKSLLQPRLADKLVSVFRPESLGRLARRRQGRERCDVEVNFEDRTSDISFGFATNSKSEVQVDKIPSSWLENSAVYLPTRELLTIYPGFVSLYEGRYLELEETWRDTCILLGAPLQRGPKQSKIQELLSPLEKALEGTVELDKNGRFYLNGSTGRMEMPLVAEGLRKVAMLARLVATGALLDRGFLFWDEPEANLNPRLVKFVAKTLLALCCQGVQVFLATHSLFLLRELQMLMATDNQKNQAAYFGLTRNLVGEVEVASGQCLDDLDELVVLEEELAQVERALRL
jgi:ABC-type transport system involved in cytochrome c biogenesis ATPase subunit